MTDNNNPYVPYQDEKGVWHSRDASGSPIYWDDPTQQWLPERAETMYYPQYTAPIEQGMSTGAKVFWGIVAGLVVLGLLVGLGAAVAGSGSTEDQGQTQSAPQAPAPVQPAPAPAPEPYQPVPDPAAIRAACAGPVVSAIETGQAAATDVAGYIDTLDVDGLRESARVFESVSADLRQAAAQCADPEVASSISTAAESFDYLGDSARGAALAIETGDLSLLEKAVEDAQTGRRLLEESNRILDGVN